MGVISSDRSRYVCCRCNDLDLSPTARALVRGLEARLEALEAGLQLHEQEMERGY